MTTIASILLLAASTVLPNGAVMTPNNEVGRTQPVVTDVSSLISRESDPNVAVTNGELWVRGERVKTGSGGTATNDVREIVDSSFAGGTQAVNRAVSDRRDRDDLRVYRRVRDIWTWENWNNPDATTNAPSDFLAAANSPGAYPLAYREATGSWMYANQYWPNGNVKYDSQMPPGGHEGALSTNLIFKFRAFPENGGTNVLFSFAARASRTSATDGTIVDWETEGPAHGAPVRIATTDLVGMELDRKAGKDELVSATNAIRRVDGAARPLPKYLHLYEADDSYPDAAVEYYRSRGDGKVDGGCSAVRSGNFLYRNFDYPLDERAEFVVKMSASPDRFASVGVAQVGTNLTEQIVTSGKPEYSHLYKWLPGATVDGINENGVVCEINVVSTNGMENWHGDPDADGIHCLAAVRWVLDHATSAGMAASNLADRVYVPQGLGNFHYMVADEHGTWVVENGHLANCHSVGRRCMTNFLSLVPNSDFPGEWEFEPGAAIDDYAYTGCPGAERWIKLAFNPFPNITNVWYTNAYRRETNPPWVSDLADVIAYTNEIFNAWESHPKEYFRGKTNNGIPWWQTVHTSVYDITNRTLRVAVQEQDDWYVFQVPVTAGRAGVKVLDVSATRLELTPEQVASGATFEHGGTNWNSAVEVGRGAKAAADVSGVSGPANLRNVGVAVGFAASVDVPGEPSRSQGVAVGPTSRASGYSSVAIGGGVRHFDDEDDMTGDNAYVRGDYSTAIGYGAKAIGNCGSALGNKAKAFGQGAVAFGCSAVASNDYAVQIGPGVNVQAHSLKFEDTTVVSNGSLTAYTKAETDVLLGGKFDKSGGTVTGGTTFVEGITAAKKSTFTRGVDVTGGVDVAGAVNAVSVAVAGSPAGVSVTSTASSGTSAGYRSLYGPESWYIESGLDGMCAFFDFYDWWEFGVMNLGTGEEIYIELPRKDGTLATLDDIPAPQPPPDFSTNNVELVDTVKTVAGGHTLFVYASLGEVIVTAVKADGTVVSRSAKGSGFYEENVVSCEIVHPGTDGLVFLRVNGGDDDSSATWFITPNGLLVGAHLVSGTSLRSALATRRAAFTLTTDMAFNIDFD